jgi:hypothetical protein
MTHSQEDLRKAKEVAESIRRMDSKELAVLVTTLCQDNMGTKLATALSYENLDQQFQSGV